MFITYILWQLRRGRIYQVLKSEKTNGKKNNTPPFFGRPSFEECDCLLFFGLELLPLICAFGDLGDLGEESCKGETVTGSTLSDADR